MSSSTACTRITNCESLHVLFQIAAPVGPDLSHRGLGGYRHSSFSLGFVFLMIYEAFYRSGTGEQPISLPQLAVYVWLQQAFLALIMLWYRDNELFGIILNGNVAYELCRPVDLYGFWYARLLGQRLSAAALRCVPILLIAVFLPPPFRLGPPASVGALAGFVATMLLGLLIVVTLSMLIYVLTFLTMSPAGTAQVFAVVAEFLSGGNHRHPADAGKVAEGIVRALPVLPIPQTLPFRVYSGHLPLSTCPGCCCARGRGWPYSPPIETVTLRRILRRVVGTGRLSA